MIREDRTLQVEITINPARGRAGRKRQEGAAAVAEPPRVPRVTRLMALAIKFQDMVDRGEVKDYADLARLGFVTRARLTQIMNLLLLAPDIQELLLIGSASSIPTERDLRSVNHHILWEDQRRALGRKR